MEEESDTGRIVKQKGDSDEKINIQEGHNLHGRQKSRLCFFIPFFRKGMNYIKGQPPGRIIAMGFAFVILTGSFLLMLPCSDVYKRQSEGRCNDCYRWEAQFQYKKTV